MFLVIHCPWSHEHQYEVKQGSVVLFTAATLGYAYYLIKDFIQQQASHLQLEFDVISDPVHQTVVYGGIGFFLIVKVKED